jgi:hypothetical protein
LDHTSRTETQAAVVASQLNLAENSLRTALARSDFGARDRYSQEIRGLGAELAEPNQLEREGQELTGFFEVVMKLPNP